MKPDLPDYPTLTDAVQLGVAGMARALDHANAATLDALGKDDLSWGDLAYAYLLRYARAHEEFISEDVSYASRLWGMIQPPTDRAWGAIYTKAARHGYIIQVGAGKSRRRHGSICPRWRSLIYQAPA